MKNKVTQIHFCSINETINETCLSLIMIIETIFRLINNGNMEQAKKALLYAHKCIVLARVLKYCFYAEAEIVRKFQAKMSLMFL